MSNERKIPRKRPNRAIAAAAAALLSITMLGSGPSYGAPVQDDAKAETFKAVAVDYSQLTGFLRQIVMDVGKPDRVAPSRPIPPAGTRLYPGNKKITRAEANRVFYHLLMNDRIAPLSGLRESLESVPDVIDFKALSGDERLAYWLNLRNLAVMELVAEVYPIKNAQKHVEKHLDDPRLTVAGEPMSIRDIENHVIAKWDDPLVVYGFYRGHIGSPNMRPDAYTGATVWDDLDDNAREFAGSLRGLQFKKSRVTVSEFYGSVSHAFPDFTADLSRHMVDYLPYDLVPRVANAATIYPTIEDGFVADLYDGRMTNMDGFDNNVAALIGNGNNAQWVNFIANRQTKAAGVNLPVQVIELMTEITKRNKRRAKKGRVQIDNLSEGEVSETEEDQR